LVTDAGFFPRAVGHRVERTQGAPTHLLIACLRGKGWARQGDNEMPVGAGQILWLPARRSHSYGADLEDPWSIAWVHFEGTECQAWRDHVFPKADRTAIPAVAVPKDRLEELALDRVHACLESGYSLADLLAATTALKTSLVALRRLRGAIGGGRSAQARVIASVDRLRREWAQPFRLSEMAAAAGLSPSHYTKLFRHQTGFAPIDFLLRQRLQQAARLLVTTHDPIGSIAAQVGYTNAYYFSRLFSQVMGCSPRAYRQRQNSLSAIG
jgi:AraC-like DNA-binding protein